MTKDNTNKKNKSNEKPIWNKNFGSIPEVLTVTEVADYLRIDEKDVLQLIDQNQSNLYLERATLGYLKDFYLLFLHKMLLRILDSLVVRLKDRHT